MSGAWRGGVQAEHATKDRTHRAELVSVDDATGLATVKIRGSTVKHQRVPLPLQVSLRGFETSWFHAVPQDGDLCEVAYDTQGKPRVIAIEPASYEETVKLADARDGGVQVFKARPRKGEFGGRSKGGAFFRGHADGRFVTASGAVSVTLDGVREEAIVGGAAHVKISGDGCEVRLGTVRRKSATGFVEKDVTASEVIGVVPVPLFAGNAASTAPAKKEWRVRVGQALDPTGAAPFGTPALYPALYEVWAGDLRDALPGVAAPMPGPWALPLRYRSTVYGDDGATAVARVEIDHLGNAKVTLGQGAVLGGLTIEAPAAAGAPSVAPLSVTMGSVSLVAQNPTPALAEARLESATGSAIVKAAIAATVEAPALSLNIGGEADDNLVRGMALYRWLTQAVVVTPLGTGSIIGPPFAPGAELSLGRLK